MTRQRRVILEEVRKSGTHPTANEIYEVARKRLPRTSLATVYRNLDVLAEAGEIVQLDSQGGQRRFDGNTEDHYHVVCVGCGKTADVEATKFEVPVPGERDAGGYEVIGHRLEFLGICFACRSANTRRGDKLD